MKRNTDSSRPFGQRLVDRFTAGLAHGDHSSRNNGGLTRQTGFGLAETRENTRQRGQRSGKVARLRHRNVWTC